MHHPILLILLTVAGAYGAKLWRDDVRAASAGRPHPHPLPGATLAPARATVIAIVGALGLLAAETAGEISLGVAAEQSRMTWLLALYAIGGAPVLEELIFRGWLVVENRGRAVLWLGAGAASVAFALLHPFLWEWDDAGFRLTLTRKGAWSTVVVLAASLWFYTARFAPWNPQRSLLPCFAAHAAKNAGVVAIKAATGFMAGLW